LLLATAHPPSPEKIENPKKCTNVEKNKKSEKCSSWENGKILKIFKFQKKLTFKIPDFEKSCLIRTSFLKT
jgi:hypothetical protein